MTIGRDGFQALLDFIENSTKIEDLNELQKRLNQYLFNVGQLHQIYLAAVIKYPDFITSIPLMLRDKEICLIAVEKFHFSTFMPSQLLADKDIQYAIVCHVGTDLSLISPDKRTLKLCVAAVNQTPAALALVPERLIHRKEFDKAIVRCRELIPQYPSAIRWLPPDFISLRDCEDLLKAHPDAWQYIPKKFRIFDLYKTYVEDPTSEPLLPWLLTQLVNYKDDTLLTDKEYQRLVHMIVIKKPVELLPWTPPAMHFELCLDIAKANKSGLELVKQLKPKLNLTDEKFDEIEKRVAAISTNKTAFLENLPQAGKRLKARDLPVIIHHYSKKYGVRIYLNGETDYGKEAISKFSQQTGNLISQLKNASIKYAVFYCHFFNERKVIDRAHATVYGPRDDRCPLFNIERKVDISKYLDEHNEPRKDLSPEELEEINNLFLVFLEKNDKLKHDMDSAIDTLIEQLPNVARDKCLDKTAALEEVRRIQPTLKEGEWVGYFFTGDHRELSDHFEVYIVSRDRIIRPVDWGNVPVDKTLIHKDVNIADACIEDFVDVENNPNYVKWSSTESPKPQASLNECGTLGMLYLKELLQQDGKQLKNSSLMFPYYKRNISTRDVHLAELFFPAPHALHYSQSEGYNKVMQSMLADTEEPIRIVHNDKIFTVTTIKSMLTDTREIALANQRQDVADECSKLLALLPGFSQKWLAEYDQAMSRREMMDLQGLNRYLNYKSTRLHGMRAGFFEHKLSEDKSEASVKTDEHLTAPRK